MSDLPDLTYGHLLHLLGPHGLFEHAEFTTPRIEHGYCTDDNARLLVLTAPNAARPDAALLSRVALDMVLASISADGKCHNRMDTTGAWVDEPSTDDCWGRAVWALGVASTRHPNPTLRMEAFRGFSLAASQTAPSPRSMAFAALGAAAVAATNPRQPHAQRLLRQTLSRIGPVPSGSWIWPEPRLAYANAVLAEALIAAGAATGSDWDLQRGLRMLAWLLDRETRRGHLSLTPAGGAGPGDDGPGFDQQPIEAAALADACSRAYTVTGEARWLGGIMAAARWFVGDNDAHLPMFDSASEGGYDGLQRASVNLNQGAESTLALLTTMERAHALVPSA